jgi:hypothetical protein
MNEMNEVRGWCEAVPPPAPVRLTKALDRLDAAVTREADGHRPVTPGHRAVLLSRRRSPGWLAPLASAAALVAVVAGTFAAVGAVHGTRPGPTRPAAGAYPGLVCVLSRGGIVTRIRDGRVLAPVQVSAASDAIAVTPDGGTAYVAAPRGEGRPGVVVPIRLATGAVLRPIPVGVWPSAISVTADGRTAYVVNFLSGTVTPIATATNRALAPIEVGSRADEVVAAPDGRTLYVSTERTITPVRTATGARLRPVPVPGAAAAAAPGHEIVVAPDSKTGYVPGSEGGLQDFHATVTPIRRDHALTPIIVPQVPDSTTLAPGGRIAYAVSGPSRPVAGLQHPRDITPINLQNGTTLPPMTVRASAHGWGYLTIAPGGRTAYFLDTLLGAVTPIHLATRTVGRPIPSGDGSYAMLFGQGASIGYLIESGQVVPLNTATNRTLRPIKLPRIIGWGEAVRR